ncbi:MAG: DNA-deoxyinosine glycosylase [Zetaproteobacteria bacterium]|nr:MAG: DNA-deoxyinosine glycosylase [Zetaproteobacteria bacterium]
MDDAAQNQDTGFPYSAASDARVLILGSMPSRKSLAEQQYYAHPRNAFWPIMGELFGFDTTLPYGRRLHCLRESGIALWDVAHQCVRPGSLDANMRNVQANDFSKFFAAYPRIHAIFFNGRMAESLFRKLVLPQLDDPYHNLPLHCLPSTSPAHAARSFAQKLTAWKTIKQALETGPV